MEQAKKLTKEELVKQFRTDEILAAARSVVNSEGYENLTLEKVADAAGISKGTIYLYFKGKRDLTIALIQEMAREGMEELLAGAAVDKDPLAKLRRFVNYFLEQHFRNEELTRLMTVEINIFRLDPESEEILKLIALRQEIIDYTAQLLTEGQKTGHFRKFDVQKGAEFLINMLEGCKISYLVRRDHLDREKLADQVIDFYIRGISK